MTNEHLTGKKNSWRETGKTNRLGLNSLGLPELASNKNDLVEEMSMIVCPVCGNKEGLMSTTPVSVFWVSMRLSHWREPMKWYQVGVGSWGWTLLCSPLISFLLFLQYFLGSLAKLASRAASLMSVFVNSTALLAIHRSDFNYSF